MTTSVLDSFEALIAVVKKLRDPNGGCPWDLEQTHDSLTPYVIEEAYEVVDAIKHKRSKLPEELGDLLLQVVLHAQVATDEKTFTLQEVVDGITKKLIHRHPHVFGETKVRDTKQVLENWERQKAKEHGAPKSILDGVPLSMPALLRAQRLGDKAARVGFDWETGDQVLLKVREELDEFLDVASPEKASPPASEPASAKTGEAHTQKSAKQDEEFGDLLFALVQWARKNGRTAEELLNQANEKFIRRFQHMEQAAATPLHEASKEDLERRWSEAKKAVG